MISYSRQATDINVYNCTAYTPAKDARLGRRDVNDDN